MNNIPLVSIIVPVYNIEKYISKCIESVLSQTFKDWELILVDDGSTDNSGKICDEYALKDNRIKVIHKENEGVTATRDKGVKEAQGEFLFFIDGDDYITDNALELFTNKQKENDTDLVRGNIYQVSENGEVLMNYISPNFSNVEEWIKYIIKNGGYICNNLIRKNLYNKYVNIPNNITLCEDLLSSLQLGIGLELVSFIEEITYYYVQRISSAMHTSNKKPKKEYENYLFLIKELDKIHSLYKQEKKYRISKIIETLIFDKIFLKLINNKTLLKPHKNEVFILYINYFVFNFNVQWDILNRSWKCYLYNWWCLTKFI